MFWFVLILIGIISILLLVMFFIDHESEIPLKRFIFWLSGILILLGILALEYIKAVNH